MRLGINGGRCEYPRYIRIRCEVCGLTNSFEWRHDCPTASDKQRAEYEVRRKHAVDRAIANKLESCK